MKFLRRSASQRDLRDHDTNALQDITNQYANKSEDLLSSIGMKRGSMLSTRSKTPTGRITPDDSRLEMNNPVTHRGHELHTVNETLEFEFEEDGLKFSFPTPRLSPPRDCESQRACSPEQASVIGGSHNQLSKWGRSLKPDASSLKKAQSSLSMLSMAQSAMDQPQMTALPVVRKKKSGWNALSSLFRRSSRQLTQEPFYKLHPGSHSELDSHPRTETPDEVPRFIPTPTSESRAPSRQQVEYYNSKPLPSPVHQTNRSDGSSVAKSSRERNDSLLEYREVKWPSARKRQNANQTIAAGQLPVDAPALDVDIPGSPIMKERYSVMFGSLLSGAKRESVEQPKTFASHERKRSKSMSNGVYRPELNDFQGLLSEPPAPPRQSRLFLVPQTCRPSEQPIATVPDKVTPREHGTRQGWLKKMISTPNLSSKDSPVSDPAPPVPQMITVPYSSTPQEYLKPTPLSVKPPKMASLPFTSPAKRPHISSCMRPSPPQSPKKPRPSPASASLALDTEMSVEPLAVQQPEKRESPTFFVSDSESDYGDDDNDDMGQNIDKALPTTPSPKRARETCFYDEDGFLVEDTARVTPPRPLQTIKASPPSSGVGKSPPGVTPSWPPKRKPIHARHGSQVRHAKQMSVSRASGQILYRGQASHSRQNSQHRYSHYRQDSEQQLANLQSWVEQQSEAVQERREYED